MPILLHVRTLIKGSPKRAQLSVWAPCDSPDPLGARAKVPILQHGDLVLIESAIICDYVDEAFPNTGVALMPTQPNERYNIRLFSEAFSSLISGPATKFMSAAGTDDETATREVS